jgi:hypothetical protein
VHDTVSRQTPDDPTRLAITRPYWELNAVAAQPDMRLTRGLELNKLRENELQRFSYPLILV